MKIVDLNVLLYAVNEDAHHHRVVLNWWEQTVSSDETVGLPWIVVLGFLRIATNPRVFPKPLSVEAAVAKLERWLSLENVRPVQENERHWRVFLSLLVDAGTAGNLTTDAHLATLAICHGAVLVSCDADFARFKGLRWENPSMQE